MSLSFESRQPILGRDSLDLVSRIRKKFINSITDVSFLEYFFFFFLLKLGVMGD